MSQISWPTPPTLSASVKQTLDDFCQEIQSRHVEEVESEYGFEFVANGQRRNVYKHPDLPNDFVVKIAMRNGGFPENEQEHSIRDRLPTAVRDRFVPLAPVAPDYSWGVAPRVNPRGGLADELEPILEEHGVYLGGELFVENVGEYQQHSVVLDYGLGLSF